MNTVHWESSLMRSVRTVAPLLEVSNVMYDQCAEGVWLSDAHIWMAALLLNADPSYVEPMSEKKRSPVSMGSGELKVHLALPAPMPFAIALVLSNFLKRRGTAPPSPSEVTEREMFGSAIQPIPTWSPVNLKFERFESSVWSAVTILFHSVAESCDVPAVAAAG